MLIQGGRGHWAQTLKVWRVLVWHLGAQCSREGEAFPVEGLHEQFTNNGKFDEEENSI